MDERQGDKGKIGANQLYHFLPHHSHKCNPWAWVLVKASVYGNINLDHFHEAVHSVIFPPRKHEVTQCFMSQSLFTLIKLSAFPLIFRSSTCLLFRSSCTYHLLDTKSRDSSHVWRFTTKERDIIHAQMTPCRIPLRGSKLN